MKPSNSAKLVSVLSERESGGTIFSNERLGLDFKHNKLPHLLSI